ncbi:cyclic nucleotide-binding domain-containing protein [Pseudopelagicola sp. nBUS_20]|uniref:cyclic nucleotide-binding domain-containing protein n=1 Tax=Pseudopelagicola sp. nBUS_20 TaxID=3395317 RepID=UPI003EB936D1
MSTKRFEEIRGLPLFEQISDASFQTLTRGAYLQNFPPHTELVTEGESADFLHIVATGIVELHSTWEDRETTMTLLEPYATFILAATIKDRPYLMSARAVTKVRIIMIPSEDVRGVFEADSDFAKSIVTELASCYRESIKIMKTIKLRTSVERLANYLVKHSTQQGTRDAVTLPIEKKKIASYLGMTPENLSRAFAALKIHGVAVNGELITLTDPDELRHFSRPNPLIDD